MSNGFGQQLAALHEMSVDQLRDRYTEVFGAAIGSGNRQHLIRRIAWRLQALKEGDISQRARQRAAELIGYAELEIPAAKLPSKVVPSAPSSSERTATNKRRSPSPGTVISRRYKGQTIVVHVLDEGFHYDGQTFNSLSAVAKVVTGSHWNGFHFFGLRKHKGES